MSHETVVAAPEPATTAREWKETETGSVFVSNYPPYSFWREEGIEAVQTMLDAPPQGHATSLGLYLHIPFCRKRCKFCYFRVYTGRNPADVQRYLDTLAREVEIYSQKAQIQGRSLDFVYFGGGTPSFIGADRLKGFVQRITQAMPWDKAREVAFECEPGTLTQSKLEAIRDIGVTRLSLGVENLSDEILRENGRAHVTKEIYRVLPWVKEMGFEQVNMDLIAGMVGETFDSWKDTVQKMIDLDPDSVTIYQLELPHNTTYSKNLKSEDGARPVIADWDTKRAWHNYALDAFGNADYEFSSAYTIVKKGRPKKFLYRDALWHGADMIGAGVSAFSQVGGVLFQNQNEWDPYLNPLQAGQLPLNRAYQPSPAERMTREMILQLKLGVIQTAYFKEKFGVEILDDFGGAFLKLQNDGMLEVSEKEIRMTRAGLLRVDQLLPNFYAPQYRNARYT
jgi:oxygen-independent coproporphyrinogen III oxidase